MCDLARCGDKAAAHLASLADARSEMRTASSPMASAYSAAMNEIGAAAERHVVAVC